MAEEVDGGLDGFVDWPGSQLNSSLASAESKNIFLRAIRTSMRLARGARLATFAA